MELPEYQIPKQRLVLKRALFQTKSFWGMKGINPLLVILSKLLITPAVDEYLLPKAIKSPSFCESGFNDIISNGFKLLINFLILLCLLKVIFKDNLLQIFNNKLELGVNR